MEPDMLFRSVHLQTRSPGSISPAEELTVSVTVQPAGLLVQVPGGKPRIVDFNQVRQIRPGAYRLEALQLDGTLLTFSQLGYETDPFVHQVFQSWNAFVSSALFVDEPCLLEVKGDHDYQAPAVPLLQQPALHDSDAHGDTRFRLYDSSLMVLPLRGPVRRIPLCFVQDVRRDGWQIVLRTDTGETLSLGRLGHDTEPMLKGITDAMQRQTARAADILRQVLGSLAPVAGEAGLAPLPESVLQSAAWLLREGRAVDWQVLDQTCPGLTVRLDRLLRQWSAAGYYDALLKTATAVGSSGLSIGIRREQGTDALADASSEATGETAETPVETAEPTEEIAAFWLAAALHGRYPAVVVEGIASQPLAQATYLFGLAPDPAGWPQVRQLLNQGLEAVDFRKQPVYFPLEKLQDPAYQRDLAALRFCPPLSFLRQSYRRRLIHHDPAKWQAALRKHLQEAAHDPEPTDDGKEVP
jgi:hypothetical protein